MRIEIEEIPCCVCGKLIKTQWEMNDDGTNNGMLRGHDHGLLAEFVIHNDCFEKWWGENMENNK